MKNLNPLKDARFRWEKSNGDFQRGLIDSASISFATAGKHTITLKTETFQFACKDTFTREVTVYPNMSAQLSITDTSLCVTNNLFNAGDETDYQGFDITNQWSLNGLETESDTLHLSAHFDTAGTQTFQLIVGPESSCPDTISRQVVVQENVETRLQMENTALCLSGNEFNFSVIKISAEDSITAYQWKLSENNTSNSSDVSVNFNSAGQKDISVFIRTTFGCKDTVQSTVTVHPQLNPSIVAIDSSQCLRDNTFQFSYQPTNEEDSIRIISWDLADALTSTDFDPRAISYSNSGTKNIQVNTISIHNCKDSAVLSVLLYDNPEASFVTDSVCLNELSTAISTSTPENDIISYEWEVDDNSINGDKRMETIMSSSGEYNVELVITTANGCTDSVSQANSLMVLEAPEADFNYELFPQNTGSLSAEFTDLSSADVVYRSWSFPNGASSTDQNPKVNFTQAGKLNILLYVENIAGCSDTALRTIDFKPIVKILVPSGFTPDENGLNDGFGPGLIERNDNYSMKIYSRWGELLFESTDVSQRWDGTYRGESCPSGTYLYVIGYTNDFQYEAIKGTVSLIR